MKFHLKYCLLALTLIALESCSKDSALPDEKLISFEVPKGFPTPFLPEENPLTQAKIDLGKALFFDNILSKDSSVSCASCHVQSFGFSDPRQLSTGVDDRLGFRNAQPLINLAWKNHFFRDGGVQLLELTALNSIHNPDEFQTEINVIQEKLSASPKYRKLFQTAYNDTVTLTGFLRAIGTYLRTLVSAESTYDYYRLGYPNTLNNEQIRGMNLFFSDSTSCSSCHSTVLFTNNDFEANGLVANTSDPGRHRVTLNEVERNKFLVPTLRNCEVTAPYMHDGSLNSLEEVVDRYNQGGSGIQNQSELIRPLGLSDEQKSAIVSFLKALTDQAFLSNKDFQPETP